jgi:non-heme chloroperoxidase
MRFIIVILGSAVVCFAGASCTARNSASPDKQAPAAAAWQDPSPHAVQFVTVDKDVKLEVLDWGGTGRPVVLLSGLGNTAHVFDDFAPKLTAQYRVYGITRRGYGASSAPATGYTADRLGDDVIAVLDALKLERPVLVGHSIAGEELSSVGTRHPERIAGLVYLEAYYGYAYYDRSLGWWDIDLNALRSKLRQMNESDDPWQLGQEVQQNELPAFERQLRELTKSPQPPSPSSADLVSFQALGAWFTRTRGITFPEAEFRAGAVPSPDGKPTQPKTPASVPQAIVAGEQKYTDIRVPILAICAIPQDWGPYVDNDPAARSLDEAWDMTFAAPQAKAFENGVPHARVVRLAHANHYVFLSNEADVLREIRAFISALP